MVIIYDDDYDDDADDDNDTDSDENDYDDQVCNDDFHLITLSAANFLFY